MKKDNLLSSLLGQAALLLMATTALVVTSCSQDNEEPGGTLPEGKITLVPTVAPVTAWSTADDAADNRSAAPGTRADTKIDVTLAEGGEILVAVGTIDDAHNTLDSLLSCNYYTVTADGRLSRLAYAGRQLETEAPLSVDAPGQYSMLATGTVNLTTGGISYSTRVGDESGARGTTITIGADGKLTLPLCIFSAGLQLSVKASDGTTYTGADVTATLKTVTQFDGRVFDVKTLTTAAPSAIWGDIYSDASVNAGDLLLELTVSGGKTYRVNAPRQITFNYGRLYTFNVRVGATGITVSSDDLGIADFEAQVVTNAEADPVPLYNGAMPNLLAIAGQTAYWVAPVDAKNASGSIDMTWDEAMAADVCPAGWHVPAKEEFKAMTGITTDENNTGANYDAIKAAFPADNLYWSSTELDMTNAWSLLVYNDGTSSITNIYQTGKTGCVVSEPNREAHCLCPGGFLIRLSPLAGL